MVSETSTTIPNRSEGVNGLRKAEAEGTQAASPAPLDDAIARIVDKLSAKAEGVQAAFGEPDSRMAT